jgi:hypothetical protein
MGLIDASQAIDQPLYRTEDTIGEGPLTLEDVGHVKAQWPRTHQHKREKEEDLKPAIGGH